MSQRQTALRNRQWVLARRPVGEVSLEDFVCHESEVREPADGQVLLRNLVMSNAPAMREWIDEAPGTAPTISIGSPVHCGAVAEVVQSRSMDFKPGELVTGIFGWQEYLVLAADERWDAAAGSWAGSARMRRLPEGIAPNQALGVLGGNGMAAYFGLLDVGRPSAGEVVVVSAAGGATGSIVGQIAKLKGCRVVGIAGGREKCRILVEELGFDQAIDHKGDDFEERLAEICPDGINLYFDNVQGSVLDICLRHLAKWGRVVLCGGVGVLNSSNGRANYNLMQLVWKRARMEGFSIFEYNQDRHAEARRELANWVGEGKIRIVEDNRYGFEMLPSAFIDLLKGNNLGKQLIWLNRGEDRSTERRA
jgi:NADPH-dependent curcumin reductase CurA